MTRLTFFCVVLLVLSALSLVSAQYRARQLFIDLDQSKAAARKLDVEWRTLQLDQTNYSKNSLIEATAERDLKMQRPTPRRMQFITLPDHPTTNLQPVQGPASDAVTKDAVTRDAVTKDAVTKDAMTRDAVTKDTVTKDAVTKDAVTKEAS